MAGAVRKRGDRPLEPHESLLLACVAELCGGAAEALNSVLDSGGIDWPAGVRDAISHGVAPLLGPALESPARASRVPREIAGTLTRIARANGRRNDVLSGYAARVVRALASAGIPSLVLKGAALATTAYPDRGLRSLADIDVLVPELDFAAARATVESTGFVAAEPPGGRDDHHAMLVADCGEDILTGTLAPEYEPRHAAHRIVCVSQYVQLEIHRGLFVDRAGRMRRTDHTPLWEAPTAARFTNGTPFQCLSPEATLVHLAAHSASHGFRRLLYPLDAALVLGGARAGLDWQRVWSLADRFAVRAELGALLVLTHGELAAAVPECELAAAEAAARRSPWPRSAGAVFAAMRRGASLQALTTIVPTTAPRAALAGLCQLAAILYPGPARMRRIYGPRPPVALAALYLLRPAHLLWRLGAAIVRERARG